VHFGSGPAVKEASSGTFKETFANQRDVVKNERRQRIENAPLGGVARVELEALFPPGHPYHHEVMGSMKDLDAASEDDIRAFFNRYYAPNNAVLLIAGDLDVAQVKAWWTSISGPSRPDHRSSSRRCRLSLHPPANVASPWRPRSTWREA